MTLRRREYLVETKSKAWREKYDFRYFDDPWKVMSPEDRKEAGRLQRLAFKAFPSSPRQKELRAKLNALLKKYGIGEKTESKVVDEAAKGLAGKRKEAVRLVNDMLTARRNGDIRKEQDKYVKLRYWCEKSNFDLSDVYDWAVKELKKSIAASMGGIV